ncbi:squalene/phytoene synthase family protein [Paenactinomyces guangxiensis]|uniref:Phytoene/squalene synthase family protein n=1 Tax=Paenactinomyces guangxiensis TaxID=1490290 RepID=A0A7W1WSA3_9BACL|nr:phytoene/squalene synthase family protein [Paenactinomyces guangxiensis]MBA4495160.1 phytoene/squalene synthase family protein [Paenactinomyces guangxiensis]MBH8592156.1 phytoene/squalene synthase family protein [Paenactinomyces guangxiensis]
MSKMPDLHKDAMDMLLETSRTFFIPINGLPAGLKEAVTAAYLCMRAIDEIEDHPQLPSEDKGNLLRSVSRILQKPFSDFELTAVFEPYKSLLPEVTLRMSDWAKLIPTEIQSEIYRSTATMADGMAEWVSKKWIVKTEEDLDQYTFYVAGLVGLLLTDLWEWYDGSKLNRDLAVGYGRGLQAVNIIRNRDEDLSRGVDFFPDGWTMEEMFLYARRNLALADVYTKSIQSKPILDFCKIPLVLAYGTLNAITAGETKLSRADVTKLVREATEK